MPNCANFVIESAFNFAACKSFAFWHIDADVFKLISFFIQISMRFIPEGPIYEESAMV